MRMLFTVQGCCFGFLLFASGALGDGSMTGFSNVQSHAPVTSFQPSDAVAMGVDGWNFTLVVHLNTSVVKVDNPETQCDPMDPSPDIAPDGLPYFAARSHFLEFDPSVSNMTGFKLVEVNWNPCGHPPVGIWTIPHYDIHFYYMDYATLQTVKCDGTPSPPICADSLSTSEKFFKFPENMANLIADYEPDGSHMGVEMMGMHWFTPPTNFSDVAHVMGTYDGAVSFFEVMAHTGIAHGAQENIQYVNQTNMKLPTGWEYSLSKKNDVVDHMTIALHKKSSKGAETEIPNTVGNTSTASALSTDGIAYWAVMAMLLSLAQLLA